MITVLTVVLVGAVIGWWLGIRFDGKKAYILAVGAAMFAVPIAGLLAALVQVAIFGGDIAEERGIALGLGIAVALLGVPYLVFKRQVAKSVAMAEMMPDQEGLSKKETDKYFKEIGNDIDA